MTTPAGGKSRVTNQERLRNSLKAETLARRLADAYDVGQMADANREALKQVVEDELSKVRQLLGQD